MKAFFETLSQFGRLNTAIEDAFKLNLQVLDYPKGHVLLAPDTTCNHLYFVEKGLTRTFHYKNGKDITDWFSPEGSFAVSLISFINRVPDRRSIELLEPSILYAIEHGQLELLCKQHHEIEHLVRQIVSFGFVQLQSKLDQLHFATAQQRYAQFLASNSTILQRAPLGMIASFLGMTQETLSRIRAQQ